MPLISSEAMTTETISIIMPVLNEAKYLGRTLGHLKLTDSEELIVVDGGSNDNTLAPLRTRCFRPAQDVAA